jgi:HK97 gp10 family phage protein
MSVTMHIEGLREMDAALAELSKAVAKNTLIRVGKAALEPMADVARSLAPDDPETGGNDLRHSINVGTKLSARQKRLAKKEPKDFATVYMGVSPQAPQGGLQEFGTVNHGPQSFMRPAFQQEAQSTINRVATGLKPEIDKSVARARARALKGIA